MLSKSRLLSSQMEWGELVNSLIHKWFWHLDSVTALQMKNSEYLAKRAYCDMAAFNPTSADCRYELLGSDFSALYRQHNRRNGVDVSNLPEYNLDHWLDPKHCNFKPVLAEAIFHYCAHAERSERLKVCIATLDMDAAAWLYGYKNQIILDGTFGVCSSRLLVFIVMSKDEENKGVSLAFLIFSAPTGTQAMHAGYNTDILAELLAAWSDHLGQDKESGEAFMLYVAVTDTDTKERAALLRIWNSIILLMYRFHLWQCWTNRRRTLFGKRDGAEPEASLSALWKDHVKDRLWILETGYGHELLMHNILAYTLQGFSIRSNIPMQFSW